MSAEVGATVVQRLETPGLEVGHQARPGAFRLADEGAIGVIEHFLWQSAGVAAPDHHRHALPPVRGCQLVGARYWSAYTT